MQAIDLSDPPPPRRPAAKPRLEVVPDPARELTPIDRGAYGLLAALSALAAVDWRPRCRWVFSRRVPALARALADAKRACPAFEVSRRPWRSMRIRSVVIEAQGMLFEACVAADVPPQLARRIARCLDRMDAALRDRDPASVPRPAPRDRREQTRRSFAVLDRAGNELSTHSDVVSGKRALDACERGHRLVCDGAVLAIKTPMHRRLADDVVRLSRDGAAPPEDE